MDRREGKFIDKVNSESNNSGMGEMGSDNEKRGAVTTRAADDYLNLVDREARGGIKWLGPLMTLGSFIASAGYTLGSDLPPEVKITAVGLEAVAAVAGAAISYMAMDQ